MDDHTITSVSLGRTGEPDPTSVPYLVVVAVSDDLHAPSSRHLLADVDEVRFGRGARSATRSVIDGARVLELRIPDAWMSSHHGRLLRGPVGWVLDDPKSKNGSLVNGQVTRQSVVGDGALIELGHTFLLFCEQPVEHGAVGDLIDGELGIAAPALATFVGPLGNGFAALSRLATTPVSIVLLGETGTGKEVIARALHAMSGRTGAFVAVNCGALPASLLEAELFGHRRGAFTGAVGERTGLVERGAFRDDLFGRISGFTLALPPLAERRADFGLLLRALLAQIPGASELRFAPSALRALVTHRWPLNIRALEKTLLTAATLATEGVIQPSHLVELLRRPSSPDEPRPSATPAPVFAGAPRSEHDEALRERLVGLLTVHRGNVVAVSREIGTRRTQIYRWARRLGIDLPGFRR
ncbi:MAG TPA: sigma 54-interacting transcriptional regulator [Kofleriaceae bacterium]|nr:sigma 54-interacting transcriptional regulator [Kofleriaceae bacterium]